MNIGFKQSTCVNPQPKLNLDQALRGIVFKELERTSHSFINPKAIATWNKWCLELSPQDS